MIRKLQVITEPPVTNNHCWFIGLLKMKSLDSILIRLNSRLEWVSIDDTLAGGHRSKMNHVIEINGIQWNPSLKRIIQWIHPKGSVEWSLLLIGRRDRPSTHFGSLHQALRDTISELRNEFEKHIHWDESVSSLRSMPFWSGRIKRLFKKRIFKKQIFEVVDFQKAKLLHNLFVVFPGTLSVGDSVCSYTMYYTVYQCA